MLKLVKSIQMQSNGLNFTTSGLNAETFLAVVELSGLSALLQVNVVVTALIFSSHRNFFIAFFNFEE